MLVAGWLFRETTLVSSVEDDLTKALREVPDGSGMTELSVKLHFHLNSFQV
jgi:hypothetical protein